MFDNSSNGYKSIKINLTISLFLHFTGSSKMAEQLTFTIQNRERIQAVESTFGRTGKMLLKPGRILVGEGCLSKLCRRGPKPKAFFLFSDILVYGTIMVPGRWNSKQKVIPLEDVQQEDLENGMAMPNQWLIRTPSKSSTCRRPRLRKRARGWYTLSSTGPS